MRKRSGDWKLWGVHEIRCSISPIRSGPQKNVHGLRESTNALGLVPLRVAINQFRYTPSYTTTEKWQSSLAQKCLVTENSPLKFQTIQNRIISTALAFQRASTGDKGSFELASAGRGFSPTRLNRKSERVFMSDGDKYEIFRGDLGQTRKKLNDMALQGYRPILLSTLETSAGLTFTVIFERNGTGR